MDEAIVFAQVREFIVDRIREATRRRCEETGEPNMHPIETTPESQVTFDYQWLEWNGIRICGYSQYISDLIKHIMPECSGSGLHVLVTGETGTGKESVVNAIRWLAKIPDRYFRAVNCSEFSANLLASELFGHVRGAFTGAVNTKPGLLEAVDGGAIFLDELGAIPQELQAQLLRVIQENTLRPVGSTEVKRLEKGVRVFAATNDASNLRQDLKWRFEHHIHLPPLRERISDIFANMKGYLDAAQVKGSVPKDTEWRVRPDTLVRMLYSKWPGNIRELRNALETSIARWRFRGQKENRILFFYLPDKDATDLLRDSSAVFTIFSDLFTAFLLAETQERHTWAKRVEKMVERMRWYTDLPSSATEQVSELWDEESDTSYFSEALLTCADAILIMCRVLDHRWDTTRMPPPVRKNHPINPDNVYMRLHWLDGRRTKVFRLPPDVSALYNEDGSRKPIADQPVPDLTGFTEENLLREYYGQLMRDKEGVQTEVAKASGISKNAARRRLDRYVPGTSEESRKRDSKSRKRD